eukprot:gnl/TRDRNA2_/TRDRNA2_88659_c0_seq2.p1 gnl/TRDRNA2_/TRDRNA2_88659_c0~~gnl/TRDRNA2_/TRDRNA2_88659_c0_seq2.p1  ORF type:complete len:459 (+),score=48.51 gnl/TRDRNA2_/TRDRNA2_88659_c0_seq2:167-1543(+)
MRASSHLEDGTSGDKTDGAEAPALWRTVHAILIFVCHVISYADRFNISVAILHMTAEYGYTSEQQGQIFASFFLGYLVTQCIAGIWSSPESAVGPKLCLAGACAAWSVVTILTPLCADHSFELLIVSRVALGAAEGLYIPACMALIASWFPKSERARMSAFGHVGQCLGAVAAMACAPLAAQDWRLLFYGFGVIGLLFVIVFFVIAADAPASHSRISAEERAYIESNQEAEHGAVSYGTDKAEDRRAEASYIKILSTSAFWAICTSHVAYNWSWYLTLSWLPRYFVEVYDVSKGDVGQYAMWPYIAAAVSCFSWACVVDTLLMRGHLSLWHARLSSQVVSVVGPICAWTALLITGANIQVVFAAVLLTAAVALQTSAQSGYLPNMVDIGGQLAAGRIAASSNTFATLPGIVGNVLVGFWLADGGAAGGWTAVFCSMILMQALGLAVFSTCGRVTRIEF